MKKYILIISLAAVASILPAGCNYECEIYSYSYEYGYIYVDSAVYQGNDEDEARDACKEDWGASYYCQNCEKVD